MLIYENGYVIEFEDNTLMLVSSFPLSGVGAVLSEISYTIRDNDSLFSIAQKHYGATSLWYVISEWNPHMDVLELETGLNIKIPQFG